MPYKGGYQPFAQIVLKWKFVKNCKKCKMSILFRKKNFISKLVMAKAIIRTGVELKKWKCIVHRIKLLQIRLASKFFWKNFLLFLNFWFYKPTKAGIRCCCRNSSSTCSWINCNQACGSDKIEIVFKTCYWTISLCKQTSWKILRL